MKKLFAATAFLLLFAINVKAQQYGLFNTGTLFDAFENPAQKHFTLDSSRRFSSNFLFLPYFGVSAAHKGATDSLIRRSINEQIFSAKNLEIGNGNKNRLNLSSNFYLLAIKIYKSYKYNQEIGLSWQLRTDSHINYSNETLAIFDSYTRFNNPPYTDVFNSKGYEQTYHQLSITYREDIDKKLSLGVKLSLLNGVAYNKIDIRSSSFDINTTTDQLNIGLNGAYRGTFVYMDSLSKGDIFPLFKNPGASITAGFKYKSKSGYTVMGNIKDLGVIKWNNQSYKTNINEVITIDDISLPNTNSRISKQLVKVLNDASGQGGFYSLTNAKADIYISKTFGIYKPALILSKNLFYPGGDAAMVNTVSLNNFSGSIIPAYNFNGIFMVGLQGMYKTPNFELFMGSDNVAKTVNMVQGISSGDATTGSGYNAASFYMGIGFKIGRVVQHPLNSDYIPGVDGDDEKSFLQRLFSKKKKSN